MTLWHQNKVRIVTGFIILTGAAMLSTNYLTGDRPDDFSQIVPYIIWIPIILYVPAMLANHASLWLWPAVLLCAFVVLTFFVGAVTNNSDWFKCGAAIYLCALIIAGVSQVDALANRFHHR